MIKEFKEFAVKGNAIDLAVGVVVGAAFGAIVSSLVKDVIMPPIGLALGGIDFASLKIVLKGATGGDPATVVAIRYGAFVNAVIAFVVIAFVVYWISKLFIREAPAAPTKTCPFCKEPNAVDATKCKACTSAI